MALGSYVWLVMSLIVFFFGVLEVFRFFKERRESTGSLYPKQRLTRRLAGVILIVTIFFMLAMDRTVALRFADQPLHYVAYLSIILVLMTLVFLVGYWDFRETCRAAEKALLEFTALSVSAFREKKDRESDRKE